MSTTRTGKKVKKNKTQILIRYGFISAFFLLVAIAIVGKLFETTVIKAEEWNKKAKETLSQEVVLDPQRGSILADNGAIIACNIMVYDVKLDLRHPNIKRNKIKDTEITNLGDTLDIFYPRRDGQKWSDVLHKQLKKDTLTRSLLLAKGVELADFEKMKTFPFLRNFAKFNGQRNPLYHNSRPSRVKPFGTMAALSIGSVNQQKTKKDSTKSEYHGWCGLESDLDTFLYGTPGLAKKVMTTNGLGQRTIRPAINGYDIQTTINIDLQDMLEAELEKVCTDVNAEWGTAILMEVETGEIKAITNMESVQGAYGNALNRAVLPFEPGSVMKPISLMIAFEDGLVKSVNDVVDTSPFQKTSDPHAPTVKTMKQVISMSSNTGIARVIFRGYKDHPEKFYDRLESIGFFEPMNTGIKEETTPKIRRLTDKDSKGRNITMTARHLDLARQSFGYVTMIPPLYTLSVYNAIANGGKYVRPRIVKKLLGHGEVPDSVIEVSYIRERICSEETARKVRECIKEVVWGQGGTAQAVRDDRVTIAGKTGTAFPVEAGGYNKAKRRYAFCGFFPYDNPKYSCMVLIQAGGGTSANRTSGQVLKNMAIQMYAHGLLDDKPTRTTDNAKTSTEPTLSASTKVKAADLKSKIGVQKCSVYKDNTASAKPNLVPDARGLEPRSAVELMEKAGLNVVLSGQGRVVWQSLTAGQPLRKGSTITLKLKA